MLCASVVQTAQAPVAPSPLLGEMDPDASLAPLKDKPGPGVKKPTPFSLASTTGRVGMPTYSHRGDVAVTSLPLHLGGSIFPQKGIKAGPEIVLSLNGTTWALPLFVYFRSELELCLVAFCYETPRALSIL